MEHRKSEVYSGKYLGVPYEIRRWYLSDGTPCWNYYLFLIEKQIPHVFESLWLPGKRLAMARNHIAYEYNETIIGNLDWHCGCTYYEKISGFDGADRAIKVGCDYSHLYDENKSYDVSDIERDVIDCVDSLLDRVIVLQWCLYCGEYVAEVNEKNHCVDCKDK